MPRRPHAQLHLPTGGLAACISGGIERDTRGVTLTDAHRFNYYPASPMGAISWTFAGTLHLVEERGPTSRPTLGPELPRLLFCGPQRRPSASWSPGAVHALMVGFYPEALGRLLGMRIESHMDEVLPLEAVAPPAVVQACEAVFAEENGAGPFACVEARLARLWQDQRGGGAMPTMNDWLRSLTTRAAHSTAGRGLRQFQRRVKNWTGQSHRDLQLYARVEDAFIRRADNRCGETLDLAGLALDAGFTDQSHMGREIRRVTGLSPARLEELIAADESFWYYRLIDGWVNERADAAR